MRKPIVSCIDLPNRKQWETPYQANPEEDITQNRIAAQQWQSTKHDHWQLHHLHHEQVQSEFLADHGLE
jgi:hypothetical protein